MTRAGSLAVALVLALSAPASAQFLGSPFPVVQAPARSTGANPTATIGASAVNGSAATFMRSDAAPALPATLPAVSGANLTNLNAGNVATGTLAVARGGTALTSTVNFRGSRITSAQSITSGTVTKVQLNSIGIDTGSYWNGTNYWFKPLVAGTYEACGNVLVSGTSITFLEAAISKNGTSGSGGTEVSDTLFTPITSGASWSAPLPCTLVAMNGSTDTLELDVTATATGPTVREVRSTTQMTIRLVSP